MKIALLGIKSSVMDEGAKNVATNLATALSRHNDLLMCHQREALSLTYIRKLRRFNPDLVVTVHGPSPKTVLLLFMLKLLCRKTKSVIIATQPGENRWLPLILRIFRPDLMFSQSNKWRKIFARQGITTEMLSNGVDTDKFKPATDPSAIDEVRNTLDLTDERPVALHIGPVNHNRNLELLVKLQNSGAWQVVVIGSTTAPFQTDMSRMLKNNGLIIKTEYFPDISLVYALADVYIFPVMDRSGSIEIPLTVLEAMACNRPVATYPFRGLPDFIVESESMRYFNDYKELTTILPGIMDGDGNRKAAMKFSWDNIASEFCNQASTQLGIK